jgi:hypothetical protein
MPWRLAENKEGMRPVWVQTFRVNTVNAALRTPTRLCFGVEIYDSLIGHGKYIKTALAAGGLALCFFATRLLDIALRPSRINFAMGDRLPVIGMILTPR